MLQLLVKTVDLETGQSTLKTIDHDNREDRQWLGKHCFWAFRNNRRIETSPITHTPED